MIDSRTIRVKAFIEREQARRLWMAGPPYGSAGCVERWGNIHARSGVDGADALCFGVRLCVAGSVEWRVAPHRNSTGVPTAVRRARNRASQFVSLTQPCDDV